MKGNCQKYENGIVCKTGEFALRLNEKLKESAWSYIEPEIWD